MKMNNRGGNPMKTNKGGKSQLPRGRTAQAPGKKLADRPPKVGKGGVANDFLPAAGRSAVMPPPAKDTQEPMMSSRSAAMGSPAMKRGPGKGLSKGRR